MNIPNDALTVLAATEINANASLELVADRTGLPPHKVRYHIQRLKDLGIINAKLALVDTYRLSLLHIGLLFSFSAGSSKKRLDAIKDLTNFSDVAWTSDLVGNYEFGALLICKEIEKVNQLLAKMRGNRGLTISNRAITFRTGMWIFPRRYLAPQLKMNEFIHLGCKQKESIIIDEIDHRLLKSLTREQWSEPTKVSRLEKLTLPTVYRRISHLTEIGLLRAHIWGIDFEALNIQRYRLLLKYRDPQQEILNKLINFALSEIHIINLVECIGNWDYEISLEVNKIDQLSFIINRLHDSFDGEIIDMQSLAVNRYRKFQMMPDSI